MYLVDVQLKDHCVRSIVLSTGCLFTQSVSCRLHHYRNICECYKARSKEQRSNEQHKNAEMDWKVERNFARSRTMGSASADTVKGCRRCGGGCALSAIHTLAPSNGSFCYSSFKSYHIRTCILRMTIRFDDFSLHIIGNQ